MSHITLSDVSEDEDYSVSLSAVLRQRRASVRRSRKGRARRPSSPFLPEDIHPRRRSSVFTTSSGDTAISIEEQPVLTQEQIFENIHLHKQVLSSAKQQPLGMRRKLKIVHQAKGYIKRHEGKLQERLAQSKSTRDIYARFNILMATKWQQLKREAANISNLLIPWELRIKEIESHFGSVVASYFTFLRWLFWINLVIAFILLVFVIVPEYLTANPKLDGERKIIMEHERRNATNLLTLWEFEGILKYSPIFYGYYSNVERSEYKMPLAYFLTGLVVYVYSFVAILRKMAENSRMSKLSEKDDECIFSWKLFTGWDYMIGNAETAHNRIASVILGFKEALLEEAEKKKNPRNWRTISLRALVNFCVVILLAVSAYAVVTVVTRSDNYRGKTPSWWHENETTTVVTVISITFPFFFEFLGFLEHFHPRKQLRLQLARIMLLNLLNLYSLIFAQFSKIDGMCKELVSLQPSLLNNNTSFNIREPINIDKNFATFTCSEVDVPCLPCHMTTFPPKDYFQNIESTERAIIYSSQNPYAVKTSNNLLKNKTLRRRKRNIVDKEIVDGMSVLEKELQRLRNLSMIKENDEIEETSEIYDYEFYDTGEDITNYTIDTLTTASMGEETTYSTPLSSEFDGDYDNYSIYNFENELTTLSENDFITENGSTISDITTDIETDTFSPSTSLFPTSTPSFNTDESSFTVSSLKADEVTTDDVTTDVVTDLNDASGTTAHKIDINVLWETKTSSNPDINYSVNVDYVENEKNNAICPNISFNCSVNCGDQNVTQTFFMSNCVLVDIKCSVKKCILNQPPVTSLNKTELTYVDSVYYDKSKRKMYNLTIATRKKLLKLCWETMFGQELVKLTMMDLVFVLLGTLFMDFFRALIVRYMNRCWCWDLEKKFPEYGDFKIAENILHLINNQGMVWMGMFFSPGLVVLNVFKLMIMMYLRSWAVMTCNVPHEVVFRVSKSNNFYLALLLTMLFLCVLPVGYTIVWVKPSWHCGPFSEYDKIYKILTTNIYNILPKSLNFALEYIASPAIVIPLLVLLILIIYYLTSLTNSLREANNDLKTQLRRERTEERRKMFQLADRRRGGSSSIDNTPFGRWKKALPSFPMNKSIDSEDRKAMSCENNTKEVLKTTKRQGIFAKIVSLALDRTTKDHIPVVLSPDVQNGDDETDTDFHENFPKAILQLKENETVHKDNEIKKRSLVEFKTKINELLTEVRQTSQEITDIDVERKPQAEKEIVHRKLSRKETSESSNQSKQSDSISSVIPVITISTTESDEEILQQTKAGNVVLSIKSKNISKENEENKKHDKRDSLRRIKCSSDLKSLQRQSSVESINDTKLIKDILGKKDGDGGHRYQYSL
ncbi:transmembrane channel-like protein [Pieris rapae]|uniref:transmembrane channel-like protein n=1 Tax=Pieris rapae TaxID=64459 RepID=UPI001E27C677|nr:transmembrane channel-like protein [Pieris rapae]